jgi:hypothetical protein
MFTSLIILSYPKAYHKPDIQHVVINEHWKKLSLNRMSLPGLEPRTVFRCCGLCFCNLLVETINCGTGSVLLSSLASGLQKPPSPGLETRTVFWSFGLPRTSPWEPGSSVSIVSNYGLNYRTIEVRSPAEAREGFLYPLCPDRLWGQPSLLYNGYRGSFPRG